MYCNPLKHEAALANKRKEFTQVLKAVDLAKKIKSDISAAKEPAAPSIEVEAQVEECSEKDVKLSVDCDGLHVLQSIET